MLNVECVDGLPMILTLNSDYCHQKNLHIFFVTPTVHIYIFSILNKKDNYSFCLMVEASDHGYVLHTRRIHVTRYGIHIQHQWRLAILNQFSVLI
jgi:hypothetical protein